MTKCLRITRGSETVQIVDVRSLSSASVVHCAKHHNKNSTKCQTILKLKVAGRQTKQTRPIRSEGYTQTGISINKMAVA